MTADIVYFAPGNGIGLVRLPFLVLVDKSNARFAERMWGLLDAGEGLDALLEELSAAGLRNLGDFALAEIEDRGGVRLVLRGSATAEVVDDEPQEIAGDGTVTWLETRVDVCASVALRLGSKPAEKVVYRTSAGVVPAVELVWTSEGASALDLGEVPSVEFDVVDPGELVSPVASDVAEEAESDEPSPELLGEQGPASQIDDRTIAGIQAPTAAQDSMLTQVPEQPFAAEPTAVIKPGGGLISGMPGPETGSAGDHDGHTISRSSLQAMRAASSSPIVPVASSRTGPPVLGLTCASGHTSAPYATNCRICGEPLSGEPSTVGRPPLGVVSFSTGDKLVLTSPAIIGRNPKATEGLHTEPPQFVRLDIGTALSRSHAAIRIEGWQVLLDDLGSQNGTTVTLPGMAPRRLHAGEPVVLEDGASIDLGGEVTAVYDARGE